MEELEKTLGSSSSVGSSVGNSGNVPQALLIDFESDLADESTPSTPSNNFGNKLLPIIELTYL
jgi:hypothetical protein